jgi:hypothetical protein
MDAPSAGERGLLAGQYPCVKSLERFEFCQQCPDRSPPSVTAQEARPHDFGNDVDQDASRGPCKHALASSTSHGYAAATARPGGSGPGDNRLQPRIQAELKPVIGSKQSRHAPAQDAPVERLAQ